MNDLDAAIAARPAPKVTPDRIAAVVQGATFHRLTETLTVCVLALANGFSVTGESACASPENYDQEIGERLARVDAERKVWALEGYLLRERLAGADLEAERIARIAHEANRAWCEYLGDDTQPGWDDAPDWQRSSAILGVGFHRANPDAGDSASHDSWMAQKLADGWIYGEVKDPDAKTHPCIVPFEDLPAEQQFKDRLFRTVVHAALDASAPSVAGAGQ